MSTFVLSLLALPFGLLVKPVCLWLRLRYLRHEADSGRDVLTAARALALAEGRDESPAADPGPKLPPASTS